MGRDRHERQIVIRGHAFDLPAAPPGWDEASHPPIRIVDPVGGAVAWLAPDVGAICVGFAVRDARAAGGWTPILRSAIPPDHGGHRGRLGCLPLVALAHQPLPAARATATSTASTRLRWRMIERDPTAVVLEISVPVTHRTLEPNPSSGSLRLQLTAQLEGGALALKLEARNEGPRVVRVGLGLRPTFSARTDGGRLVAPSGLRIGIAPGGGVRHRATRASGDRAEVSVAVLGYAPGRGLGELPPGGQTRIAVSIGAVGQGPAHARV
ncbi:MAG TPA: hypothetical protein VER37_08685 [Thermomicrobiales bacterium]|nr:hypothetical protein [Thermomicrobiales bacterium]